MGKYWLFIIPAIICALFADKIDARAKADKKLKKFILTLCAVVLALSIVGMLLTMI